MEILYEKLIISIVLIVLLYVCFKYKSKIEDERLISNGRFFLLSIALCRIIPAFVVYIFFGFKAHSDVPMFYEAAQQALKLKFVYRDFETAYQPLFPYLTALPLLIWNSAEAIVFEMIVVESLILWFCFNQLNFQAKRFKILTYLLLPAPFVLSIFGGQEDVWMWGYGAMIIVAANKKASDIVIGLIAGMSLVVTKVIFVFIIIGLFFKVKSKTKYLLGLAIVGIPTLFVLIFYSGFGFLAIINQANDPRTPNLWSILNPFLNVYQEIGIKHLNQIGLLSCLILVLVWSKFKSNINFQNYLTNIWVAFFCWFMIIQQSSLVNYIFIFMMPLWLLVVHSENIKTQFYVIILNVLAVIQPPIWWHLGMPNLSLSMLAQKNIFLIEYLLEISIVVILANLFLITSKAIFIQKSK